MRNERIVIRSIEPPIELLEENSSITPLKDIEGFVKGKGIKLFIGYL